MDGMRHMRGYSLQRGRLKGSWNAHLSPVLSRSALHSQAFEARVLPSLASKAVVSTLKDDLERRKRAVGNHESVRCVFENKSDVADPPRLRC